MHQNKKIETNQACLLHIEGNIFKLSTNFLKIFLMPKCFLFFFWFTFVCKIGRKFERSSNWSDVILPPENLAMFCLHWNNFGGLKQDRRYCPQVLNIGLLSLVCIRFLCFKTHLSLIDIFVLTCFVPAEEGCLRKIWSVRNNRSALFKLSFINVLITIVIYCV